MPIENAQYIHELNASNPVPGDAISGADDHLRNIKRSIKNSFPNVQGIVNASQDDLNLLTGKSGSVVAADIGALHGSQDASEADATTFRGMINGITGTTVSGDGIIGVTNGTVTYDNTNAAGTAVPFNANVTLTHKAKATGLNDIAASTGSYLSSVSFDEFGHVSAVAASQVIPAGVIVMWSGAVNAVPAGWVLCDGQNNTPDLRNRFVVGAGDTYAVDATGGSASTTLAAANLPAHTHTFSGTTDSISLTGTATNISETFRARGSASGIFGKTNNTSATTPSNTDTSGTANLTIDASHSHGFSGTTSSVGSTSSFTNLPPYLALAYIMKT